MTKPVAIIQARMGSTRLPGKVLANIVGRPMLWHIINRVRHSRLVDQVIVATSTMNEDDAIASLAEEHGAGVFRGSDLDVLDRYYRCATEFNVKTIVRITADDPFKDPTIIDQIIRIYQRGSKGLDYVSNTIKPTYPEGLDVEVFPYDTLHSAWSDASDKFDREHVTAYIWRNPKLFRLMNVEYSLEDLSHLRWTVDTREDLAFAKAVYERLFPQKEIFLMEDILSLLKDSPDIGRINDGVKQRAWSKEAPTSGSD